MDWSAAHIDYVVAAYAVSFAGLAFLMAFILLRDRKLKRQIATLDRSKDRRDG